MEPGRSCADGLGRVLDSPTGRSTGSEMVFNDVIDKIGMTIDAAGVVVIVTGAAIAFVVTAVIPYPQSDHHRLPGRPGRVPRDLEQARGGKNTTPGSSGAPTPGRWPGPARRGRSGGCGPNRWAAAGSGCSERPRGYFSITLSDTAGQRERAQSRRSRRLAWSAARLRVPRPNG